MECLPGTRKIKGCRIFESGLAAGRHQDAGIWVFVSGTFLGKYRGQLQNGPKSLILSAQGVGSSGAGPGDSVTPSPRSPGSSGPRAPSRPASEPALTAYHIPSR